MKAKKFFKYLTIVSFSSMFLLGNFFPEIIRPACMIGIISFFFWGALAEGGFTDYGSSDGV